MFKNSFAEFDIPHSLAISKIKLSCMDSGLKAKEIKGAKENTVNGSIRAIKKPDIITENFKGVLLAKPHKNLKYFIFVLNNLLLTN